MSHEIESLFYAREVPWHGLGIRVEQALSSADAIKVSGLEWDVYSSGLKTTLADGTMVDVPERVANIRNIDNKILAVVSKDYAIVQNREAFAFTDALLGNNGVKYETAGSLFGGRQVWLLAKMDGITVLGDKVDPYLVFTNSHDASTGVRVAITPIRVVCNNTLTMAMSGATRVWSTIHKGDIQSRLEEAKETLKKVTTYLNEYPKIAKVMNDTNIYMDEVEKIVTEIFPVNEEKAGPIKIRNVERMRNTLFTLWTETPDIQKFQGTAWGMYNALSDMVSHMKPLRETPTFAENRFATLVEGHPLLEKAQRILLSVRQ